jgi:hypothetical protein
MVLLWKKKAIESLPDVFSTLRERDYWQDNHLDHNGWHDNHQRFTTGTCAVSNDGV